MEDFIERFQNDGFCVIDNFLTSEDINLIKKECEEIVQRMSLSDHLAIFSTREHQINLRDDYFINSGDKIRFFFEEKAVNDKGELQVEKHLALNKIGHALHFFSPILRKVTHSDKVKSIMRRLNYEDPVIMQSMYIFKQPFIGGEVTPHQDGSYLYTEPMRLVGFWIALDNASAENGCLHFIPGSHKNGLYQNYRLVRQSLSSGTKLIYEGEKPNYDPNKFVEVPVRKGSLVLIDGLVVHRSDENRSSQSRHAYAFHLFDAGISKWSNLNWLQVSSSDTFTHLYNFPA